jgi:hypothetical protein
MPYQPLRDNILCCLWSPERLPFPVSCAGTTHGCLCCGITHVSTFHLLHLPKPVLHFGEVHQSHTQSVTRLICSPAGHCTNPRAPHLLM